jgi:hypothetical protein
MAHSHHMHREHQVSHRRVHHILKDEPAGAKEHSKSHAFSKVTSKTAAEHHDGFVAGSKQMKRYARGGKVKGKEKGHHTNIAIVVPPHPGGGAPAGGPIPAAPGGPPMAPPMAKPPMMPPPGGPPMGGPPGMPPGMPMRARGGGVHIDGESTKANIGKWSKRAAKNSYAKGGFVKPKVIDRAGATTGVGRLEAAEHMKRKGK